MLTKTLMAQTSTSTLPTAQLHVVTTAAEPVQHLQQVILWLETMQTDMVFLSNAKPAQYD